MTVYTERPRPRRARKVWDHATRLRGKAPVKLWKNPNCWMSPQVVGNAWGWWGAEYDDHKTEMIPPCDVT